MEYALLVALLIGEPFIVHWYVKGPVPEATVAKLAGVPGQFVSDVNGVADALTRTVSVPQLVTLVHAPVTWTQ
jgi:hypothetical protein